MKHGNTLPLLLAALGAAALAGCAAGNQQDADRTGYDKPAAPFAYGSTPSLRSDNPYVPKYDPNLIYEGYSANLPRNRTFGGVIAGWRTINLPADHPARPRFKTTTPLHNADASQDLAVYQVDVRLDNTNEIVPVLVENTRVFEQGQRVFVRSNGSPNSGFIDMPDSFPTEWHEGFDRGLLPDSEYIGQIQTVARVFLRDDNPAFPRLRRERFGIDFGRGRIDCWMVDVRVMEPNGGNRWLRSYVPLNQVFDERQKVIVRTHGTALDGWLELRGYAESLGRDSGNNRHEPIPAK